MSNLTNQLVIAERDEVSRGIRLLLANPLISERVAAESFDLIRRRREPIARWFDYYCGWSLVVEPRLGYARLAKVRPATDPSRPARRHRSGRAPFDRRRYVLLCVVAAELLPVPVTTIGLLADRVSRASGTDAALAGFDTASRGERMAFVDVLRLLESYGAIEVVDGATESYVDSEAAKVLYRIDTTLLMRLLAAPVGLSQLAVPLDEVALRFDELLTVVSRERRYGAAIDRTGTDQTGTDRTGTGTGQAGAERRDGMVPVSDTQRNLWLRHTIFRRLVDDPVLYLDDLSVDERAYLASPSGRQLLRRAANQAGFLLEERAEGVMLVDPDGLATDSRFPDDASNAKVAALHLLDSIGATAVTGEQLQREATVLLSRFPRWAKGYRGGDRGEAGVAQLVSDALEILAGFGLVRVHGGVVHPLPAAARYAVGTIRTTDSGDPHSEEPVS